MRRVLVGPPLRAWDMSREQITPAEGLSALSLDALTSVAYGPAAIVVVLAAAGAAALHLVLPITIAIVVLLVLLAFSYRQVIDAYPGRGGAYAVPHHALEAVSVLLVLKAFSAGCSALTGVEAIANGVPLFKQPRARRAKQTELPLGSVLGAMLLGLAVLADRWHIGPRTGQTVLSQIMAMAVGRHWDYYLMSLTITVVLALAANTSFGSLPVLGQPAGQG